MRASENYHIDDTFYKPPGFFQIIIGLYKDFITKEKIPGFFAILNNKYEITYKAILNSIKNILTQNKLINLNVKTITRDSERALYNSVLEIFLPETKILICYFHYKQDIYAYCRQLGFIKDIYKESTEELIKLLGIIPLRYKGDMKIFNELVQNILKKFPNYNNIINNYFVKNKKEYFENGSLNYCNFPKDSTSNSFIENFNKRIKDILGKKKNVKWPILLL